VADGRWGTGFSPKANVGRNRFIAPLKISPTALSKKAAGSDRRMPFARSLNRRHRDSDMAQ
jgi:hypothetical protein